MNPESIGKQLDIGQYEADKRKEIAGMPATKGFLLAESDRRLIVENSHTIRESLFVCTTEPQVECAVAFARYLSFCGLNGDNYWLFLRLIMTNNSWVVDELLAERARPSGYEDCLTFPVHEFSQVFNSANALGRAI